MLFNYHFKLCIINETSDFPVEAIYYILFYL